MSFRLKVESKLKMLTPSESAIAELVMEGQSNKMISHIRGTTTSTVANQLASIYRKLKVFSRAELIAFFSSTNQNAAG